MTKKKWDGAAGVAIAAVWLVLAVWAWLRAPDTISYTERRELQQFPTVEAQRLLDGKFMSEFEDYAMDQFPWRDGFRQVKARFAYDVLGQKDNHGICMTQGHAFQLEYPLNEDSVEHACSVFRKIWEKNLQESRVFAAVVPDKAYYFAPEQGYPVMDYEKLFQKMKTEMPYAQFVDLTDCLTGEDYYRTDTHWRQERLTQVTKKLGAAMGVSFDAQYQPREAENPFYGVYYGQAALPMEPDRLYTLHNDLLDGCKVYNYETNQYGGIYDWEKLSGKDPYETFLSGPVSLLRIENPQAQTDQELIVFRDSFGSSLAPLLAQGYKTVTLVDVRYISGSMLSRFLDFHGQDVLFLYSTLVLNNSAMLK